MPIPELTPEQRKSMINEDIRLKEYAIKYLSRTNYKEVRGKKELIPIQEKDKQQIEKLKKEIAELQKQL